MIMLQSKASNAYQSPRNTFPDVRNHVFGLVFGALHRSDALFLHQQELRRRFARVLLEYLVERGFGTEPRIKG